MDITNVCKKDLIDLFGTSKGYQKKWKKNNYWYKQDTVYGEGITEWCVSEILKRSSLKPEEYVTYTPVKIEDNDGFVFSGCKSKDFTYDKYELITFSKIFEITKSNPSIFVNEKNIKKRINYLIDVINDYVQFDITDYLRKVFTLDMLILNEDRHLANMSVLKDKDRFIPCPIFDNGISLICTLINEISTNGLFKTCNKATPRLFSNFSFQDVVNAIGFGCSFETAAVIKFLDENRDILGFRVNVLEYQLQKFLINYKLATKL